MAENPSDKDKIMQDFAELLPMLRVRLGLTQEEFGNRVGVTRQTVLLIENKKRALTWSMFLSMAFIFFIDPKTRPFLMASGIVSEKLSELLFGNTSMLEQAKAMMGETKNN